MPHKEEQGEDPEAQRVEGSGRDQPSDQWRRAAEGEHLLGRAVGGNVAADAEHVGMSIHLRDRRTDLRSVFAHQMHVGESADPDPSQLPPLRHLRDAVTDAAGDRLDGE